MVAKDALSPVLHSNVMKLDKMLASVLHSLEILGSAIYINPDLLVEYYLLLLPSLPT